MAATIRDAIERIIGSHKRVYPTYWAWAEAQIEQAYQTGYISISFGWTIAVDRKPSLLRRNFTGVPGM
jgi:hypothetical protein